MVLSDLARVRGHLGTLQLADLCNMRQQMLTESVFSVMFSDTIVLFTKTESDDDLQAILIAAAEMLHKAMYACVPVRIGVASGQFFFNIEESLYSGPALIEAYEKGESAQWLGVVTTEAIYKQSVRANFKSGANYVVIPASIPTKNGVVPGYAMNWVASYRHDFKVEPPISTELFYSQFEHSFGPLEELAENERMKYLNTTNFINEHLV